jgi:hypothetical protein
LTPSTTVASPATPSTTALAAPAAIAAPPAVALAGWLVLSEEQVGQAAREAGVANADVAALLALVARHYQPCAPAPLTPTAWPSPVDGAKATEEGGQELRLARPS